MQDRERFERVATLFEAARSRRGAEREAFLVESKATDPELTDDVRRLLEHHDSAVGPLSDPIVPRPGTPTAQPRVPDSINQYRVIRQLGSGGMGVVYLAQQDKPRRDVAVKVIRPGLVSTGTLRRFDAEAAMLGRLRHPGVAQIFEAGTYDDGAGARPYFAMEHVDGSPLLEYARTNKLDDRRRIELMASVSEAVHHAHQQGVIHRDLKPGNILVGKDGQPKILDFGVARATDPERQTLHTLAGELVGTVGYMSPEQIGGDPAEVDTRTDVHALGVITYELLTGRLPYDVTGVSLPSALERLRTEPPASLGDVRPTLRGDLETICATAIAKDKARRYQSASGLHADLRRYLRDEPIAARPPSTLYLLGKFAKRNRPIVAAASVSLFLLIALLLASTIGVIEVSRQRDEALASMQDAQAASQFLADVMLSLDPRQHGGSAITLEECLNGVAQQIDSGQLAERPRVEAVVRGTIGTAFFSLGLQDQSRRHLERSLALLEAHDPENTIQIADVMGALGTTLLRSGDIERAEPLLTQSLEHMEAVAHSGQHRDRATSYLADALQRLAHLRIEQRRLDQAEALSRRSLALRRRWAGEQPLFLARTLNTLAVTFRLRGNLEGARAAYEEALDIHRSIHAEPRIDTATTMNNLALVHLYADRPDLAVPLLDEVLHIRQSILPPEHHQIARTLNSLGGAKKMQGDLEGAAEAYERALQIRRAALGSDHPAVSTTLINLATTVAELDRLDEAIAMLEEAIEIRTSAYGEAHTRLAAPLGHIGRILIDSGQLDRAEICLRRSIEIYERTAPPDNTDAVSARSILGRCLALATRFEEAESVLLEAHRVLLEIEPPTPAQRRSLARTTGWLCDLYSDWHKTMPGQGHDTSFQSWQGRRQLEAEAP